APSMRDAFKRGAQAVIVFSRDRIELVVMAARTVDGEAQKGAAGVGDDVVERGGADVLLRDDVLVADIIVWTGDEEGAAALDLRVVLADHIARKVFDDELVKRLVVIDGLDDVIAERPEIVDDEVS